MGYDFKVDGWYKLKHEEKECAWPCDSDPNRTIKIYSDDVLTKSKDGTFMKQTGLGCFGIVIPNEDVELQEKTAKLRMM
jgi:hypothetical protein